MSMLSFFRKKQSPNALAGELGPLLIRVAAHECGAFQRAWGRHIDDKNQVSLFAEFLILLIAVADRFAFDKFDEPHRTDLINQVVDAARASFSNQRHFGDTAEERGDYFESLFDDRFTMYGACSSIMGDGMDSLVFTGSRHLAETFLTDAPPASLPGAVVETSKVVINTLVALSTVSTFKSLSEK